MIRSARYAFAILFALAAPEAHAAARLVISISDPVKVSIDGRPVVDTAGRVVANHLSAGVHDVVFHGLDGTLLHAAQVDLVDGAEARGRYSIARGLELRATPSAGTAPDSAATGGHTEPSPAPASSGAGGASGPSAPAESTFDMNEGSQSGVGAGSGRREYNSNADYTAQRVASGIARGAVAVASPNVMTVASVGGAVASGAANLARTAPAGGVRGWGTSAPAPRQGRPTPPDADKGTIQLVSIEDERYVVYLDGFVIAELGPGKPMKRVQLEVGRHLLELWDGDTNTVRWRGMAEVSKDVTFTVQFSDAAAPRSPDRGWAWSAR